MADADLMDLLDATIVSVAAPTIAEDLGASEAALQWTLAGYALAIGAGLITDGRIGDQFGRRRVFLLGLAGFALASAGCALAPNPEVLIATRVAQGLAGGLMVPQVFGIIRSSLGPETRSKAFGAYGAVLGLASVAGPLLGGLLVDADLFGLGWRTIFWVTIPVATRNNTSNQHLSVCTSTPYRSYAPAHGTTATKGAGVVSSRLDQPTVYQIRIKGHLGPQ